MKCLDLVLYKTVGKRPFCDVCWFSVIVVILGKRGCCELCWVCIIVGTLGKILRTVFS